MLVRHVLEIDATNRHKQAVGNASGAREMRLMLLRHARAERSLAGQRDRDRRLDDRGRRDAPVIGAFMAHWGLHPDAATVSPAVRTRETWELIAPALNRATAVRFEDRLYDASADDLLAVIRETAPTTKVLLVIGHNPGLHELAARLVGSGERDACDRLADGLPTSGLLVIDFKEANWARLDAHAGRLERFVTPRLLTTETD